MPKKKLFARKDAVTMTVRVHRTLHQNLTEYCSTNNIPIIELINELLANKLNPSMLKELQTPKVYKFPNRKR